MNRIPDPTRRRVVQSLALAAALASTGAMAQAWPSKPISLILNQSSTMPGTGYYGYGTYGDTTPQDAR